LKIILKTKKTQMTKYTIKNVSGIPCSFRDTNGTVLASVNTVTPVICYNERETDDNGKPGAMMLVFEAKIYLSSNGFKYTKRAMSMRLSAKYSNGNDLSGNPNELANVLFIQCNYNNYEQDVVFRCHDDVEGGSASKLVHAHFSFFYDPLAWSPC
jgi:hypothetical protein